MTRFCVCDRDNLDTVYVWAESYRDAYALVAKRGRRYSVRKAAEQLYYGSDLIA